MPYPVTTTGLPAPSVEVGASCQQLSLPREIRLPAADLPLGKKRVEVPSCSAGNKEELHTSTGGGKEETRGNMYETAENSELNSWSGHQLSFVPLASLGETAPFPGSHSFFQTQSRYIISVTLLCSALVCGATSRSLMLKNKPRD